MDIGGLGHCSKGAYPHKLIKSGASEVGTDHESVPHVEGMNHKQEDHRGIHVAN